MSTDHDERLRQIMRLAAENASAEEVVERARDAKAEIIKDATALWRVTAMLDDIVLYFAPRAAWETGWGTGAGTTKPSVTLPRRSPKTERTSRALEIARALVVNGARTVTTRTIVEHLRTGGISGSAKDLATGVGNTLTRSGEWRKVGPGQYAPVTEEATSEIA